MNPEGQKDIIDATYKVDQGKEDDWNLFVRREQARLTARAILVEAGVITPPPKTRRVFGGKPVAAPNFHVLD